MQVQWMEKPKSTISPTYGPATASRQPERAVPQLWTCSGYKLSNLHIDSIIWEALIPITIEDIFQEHLVSQCCLTPY